MWREGNKYRSAQKLQLIIATLASQLSRSLFTLHTYYWCTASFFTSIYTWWRNCALLTRVYYNQLTARGCQCGVKAFFLEPIPLPPRPLFSIQIQPTSGKSTIRHQHGLYYNQSVYRGCWCGMKESFIFYLYLFSHNSRSMHTETGPPPLSPWLTWNLHYCQRSFIFSAPWVYITNCGLEVPGVAWRRTYLTLIPFSTSLNKTSWLDTLLTFQEFKPNLYPDLGHWA